MVKSRIFFLTLLALVAGVAVRSFVSVPATLLFAAALGAVVVFSIGIARKSGMPIIYGLILFAFLTGIFRFEHVESRMPDLSLLYGEKLVFIGIITDDPQRTSKVQRFRVAIESVSSRETVSFSTLVTVGRYPHYLLGDEVLIRGILDRPENYGEFDYVSYLAKESIFGTIFFPEIEKIGENKGSGLKLYLSKIKRSFEEKIDAVLPEPHAAFLKGLMLGERESLPEDLVENFNKTGVTHIVALSGYNITLVGRFFIGGLMLFTVPFAASFWIAVGGILLFVILTGAAPSVVRAGIMGILVLVARREGRMYSIRNALALAAAVMIFHNPRILRFDAAFQLSFLATLGLVYLFPYVECWFSKLSLGSGRQLHNAGNKKHALFPLRNIFVETLSAQLAVLPLLIYLFGRVSFISPFTNLLVIVAVPYSMILGFLTAGIGFLSYPVSQVFGWASWVVLEYKIRVVELFARVPLASVEVSSVFLLFVMLLYTYVAWRIVKKRRSEERI